MKSKNTQVIMFCLVVLSLALVSNTAHADTWNKATKLTFTEPVEVPGMALPAGTYWFQLQNNNSNRHIVQIWNADRTQLLNTVIAIPHYRMHPASKTVIKFDERPTGSPEAIQAWFYPGDTYGQEFVYPKSRAVQLARQVNQPVLEVPDEQATAPAPQLAQAPVKAVKPTGEEVEVAEVIQTVAAEEVLPETGTSLPLLGLLGVLSMVAGFTLRRSASANVA